MNVVLPFTRGDRKAMLRNRLAGAFDAVAQLEPAAAVMFAELAQQSGAFVGRQRPDIGPAHRCGCNRDARADVKLNAERQPVTALTEIDHAVTVASADRDRAAGLAHDLLAERLREVTTAPIQPGRNSGRH